MKRSHTHSCALRPSHQPHCPCWIPAEKRRCSKALAQKSRWDGDLKLGGEPEVVTGGAQQGGGTLCCGTGWQGLCLSVESARQSPCVGHCPGPWCTHLCPVKPPSPLNHIGSLESLDCHSGCALRFQPLRFAQWGKTEVESSGHLVMVTQPLRAEPG